MKSRPVLAVLPHDPLLHLGYSPRPPVRPNVANSAAVSERYHVTCVSVRIDCRPRRRPLCSTNSTPTSDFKANIVASGDQTASCLPTGRSRWVRPSLWLHVPLQLHFHAVRKYFPSVRQITVIMSDILNSSVGHLQADFWTLIIKVHWPFLVSNKEAKSASQLATVQRWTRVWFQRRRFEKVVQAFVIISNTITERICNYLWNNRRMLSK
jgi:hypothetical protein